jgi:hypothetical protein
VLQLQCLFRTADVHGLLVSPDLSHTYSSAAEKRQKLFAGSALRLHFLLQEGVVMTARTKQWCAFHGPPGRITAIPEAKSADSARMSGKVPTAAFMENISLRDPKRRLQKL